MQHMKRNIIILTIISICHCIDSTNICASDLARNGDEFLIGGNIPGETRVLSIAIYDHVESIQYQNAHLLSASLLVFSVMILLLVYRGKRQQFSVVKA